MARQARFVLPGQVHWVRLETQPGQAAFAAQADRNELLQAVQLAVQDAHVAVHGYCLQDESAEFLLSPPSAQALGAFVQGLGRRFVGAYNRRRSRAGALWSSRYRCAALEPGDAVLLGLCAVCLSASGVAGACLQDSAGHYLGRERLPWLAELLAYWQLGNTPFAREARLRELLEAADLAARVHAFGQAARQGRAVGSVAFLQTLEALTGRSVLARRPGRPRKVPSGP